MEQTVKGAELKYPQYTEAEIEFLREYYPNNGFKATYKAFCERFGEYTEPQVLHRIKKNKIRSNNNSKFQKGHISWNTGLNVAESRPDLYESQYHSTPNRVRSGRLCGAVVRAEIGTISKKSVRDGWKIKVANPDKWMPYHRYMYEQYHNVKLTKDDKIIFLDGNRENFDVDNLYLVNVNTICMMNRRQLWTADKQLTKASILSQMIQLKIREIENDR